MLYSTCDAHTHTHSRRTHSRHTRTHTFAQLWLQFVTVARIYKCGTWGQPVAGSASSPLSSLLSFPPFFPPPLSSPLSPPFFLLLSLPRSFSFLCCQCLHAQQLFVGRQQTIKRFACASSAPAAGLLLLPSPYTSSSSTLERLISHVVAVVLRFLFRYAYTAVFDLCVCGSFLCAGKTCSHAVHLNFPFPQLLSPQLLAPAACLLLLACAACLSCFLLLLQLVCCLRLLLSSSRAFVVSVN